MLQLSQRVCCDGNLETVLMSAIETQRLWFIAMYNYIGLFCFQMMPYCFTRSIRVPVAVAGVRLKMDPPKKVPPGPFSTVETGPPLCKMDPPVHFLNGPPGPFSTVENGPGGGGGSIFNGRKWTGGSIFNVEKWTGGGPFSTGENGPQVHFQWLKMDRGVHFTQGGSIFNG